ncbi:MAG: hypothetical protein ACM3XN_10685 [Chloroflexota bacterium]
MVTYQVEVDSGRLPSGGAGAILKQLGITGEVGIRQTGNGKWILEICAEGQLAEEALRAFGTVAKFSGAASE